jgi:hypothetical protein
MSGRTGRGAVWRLRPEVLETRDAPTGIGNLDFHLPGPAPGVNVLDLVIPSTPTLALDSIGRIVTAGIDPASGGSSVAWLVGVGQPHPNPTAALGGTLVVGGPADRGGVRVAAKDADGDSKADVVVGSGEGPPSRARVYPGRAVTPAGEPTPSGDLDPFAQTLSGGVFVG